MFHFRTEPVAVVVLAIAFFLCAICPTVAFNPQPEPPGDDWNIEGFIDMTSQEFDPSDTRIPFGVDARIIGDEEVDFRAGIIASFRGADRDGDGRLDDAVYTVDQLSYFRVQIGDTDWDETMPASSLLLQVADGLVGGVSFTLTDTMPAHPDLQFLFPLSPGAWRALDERNGDNVGTIAGTYALRDGFVPEPGALALLAIGIGAMSLRRVQLIL